MGCCSKKTPIATLCPINDLSGSLNAIVNCSTWNDQYCDESKRRAKWYILKDNKVLEIFDWATLDTPIPIGVNSTYSLWRLDNHGEEVFDYLKSQGHEFADGDEIKIRVRVENCNCELSETWSNAIFMTYNCPCNYPWQTLEMENWETLSGDCWQTFPFSDDPVIAKA